MKSDQLQEEERKRIESNFYILGMCLPGIGAGLYLLIRLLPSGVLSVFSVPCLFHAVTGLYCPGCGGTRAVQVLFEGKFLLSFFYHPIVPYCAVLYLWFMISHTAERLSGKRLPVGMRYRNLYLYLALGIVVINIAVKDIALTAFHLDFLKLLDNAQHLI